MDVPLQICEARDPKGLYKLARAGKIKGKVKTLGCIAAVGCFLLHVLLGLYGVSRNNTPSVYLLSRNNKIQSSVSTNCDSGCWL